VHPPIRLFWANIAVHIDDELLLVTQVHAPLIKDLNPLRILREGNHIPDDNVNLMWHTPNVQH
jgi:hypothetical protein